MALNACGVLSRMNSNGESQQSAQRFVDYDELKRHAVYEDAWISINGTVYDITDFIDKHPFGDAFRGNLGTECGGLFSSSHMNVGVEKALKSQAWLDKNQIKVVGQLQGYGNPLEADHPDPLLDRIVYQNTGEDPFWKELKAEVRKFIREQKESTHYSFREGALYLVYYIGIYLLLGYFAWIQASFIAAFLLGFHMLCAITNVSHLVTHFGFTRHEGVNSIAKWFLDFSGMCWLEWQVAHQTHHYQPHSPIDHQTNVYGYLGIRLHEYEDHKPYQRFQHWYFWVIMSVFLYFRLVTTTMWMFNNRKFQRSNWELPMHLLMRALFFAPIIYCGFLHGFWMAFILFSLYVIAYSYSAFILLFNDHEDTHHALGQEKTVEHHHETTSWARMQVLTSNNWYPTNWLLAFIEFHYGYFNYHIEHHLFPAIKPSLCKKISPVVQRVCEKHGVSYVFTPFPEVQKSLQRHLIKMGSPA